MASSNARVMPVTTVANATSLAQAVTPGRTYYYRVLAFDGSHQSAWSGTATVVVP